VFAYFFLSNYRKEVLKMAESIAGSLIRRNYSNFRGVDFSNRGDEISLNRSPDAMNVWKNYKSNNGTCIETRPDLEAVISFADKVYGLFYYTLNGAIYTIVHAGTKLYKNGTVIYTGMAERKSNYFVYDKKLYIKDGLNYLVYDGTLIKDVEGFVPTTSIGRMPSGGGTIYQDVNLLTGLRKNSFVADGASKEYVLDVESYDSDYMVRVWINGEEKLGGFTAKPEEGKVSFTTAPTVPATTGQDNVIIQFKRTVDGYRERIEKCTLLEVFDNRVFFSGNPDYPNVLWHSSLDDPTYCSDLDYYEEGSDDSKVKAIVSGNNALWVMKEPSQSNTTIFYHNPALDDDYGKIYPSVHSSINTGCISTGVNFNDTICFFSERGLEGITGDVTTEQAVSLKSTLVNNKLLNESEYRNLTLAEWNGYLLVGVGNKIYLADSRAIVNINGRAEFEWFVWQFNKNISDLKVHNETLYIISGTEIYSLTNTSEDRKVEAYLTTKEDELNYPAYAKTTNKKGCTVDVEGTITISAKTDNNSFDTIGTFASVKGYVVPRIKKKKFKSIQIKFSSDKPFKLYSSTLECFIGSYIKR
jgi:hypothetical protein